MCGGGGVCASTHDMVGLSVLRNASLFHLSARGGFYKSNWPGCVA